VFDAPARSDAARAFSGEGPGAAAWPKEGGVFVRFDRDVLLIEPEKEAERVCGFIESQVLNRFKRKGVVVGLSGGIDSALLACLCVRAFGPDRVCGVILPEKDSSPVSETFAREQAESLGIGYSIVDVTPMIEAFGAYENRDRVIRELCPEFDPDRDTMKIVLPPDLLDHDGLNVFTLVVERADGETVRRRLRPEQIRRIQAAQNVKQRTRMIQLYSAAERLHHVVGGTTNRSEMDQGFFVKFGDGGVDIEPIAHLYKTQVFALAEHMGVTENIRNRKPSPDTWPGGVTDEEFYFRMPFEQLDLLLYAWNRSLPPEEVSEPLGLSVDQVNRAFRDFSSKHSTTWHLRSLPPSLLDDVGPEAPTT
jgi:NAD+ synthase